MINSKKNQAKAWLILGLLGVTSLVHYWGSNGIHELHMIHRELYFIPILLASFWFGLKYGLIISIASSLIYAPYIFIAPDKNVSIISVLFQIVIFNLVALVLGSLSDRRKADHQEALKLEGLAVLGRAASVVGHDMKSVMDTLMRLASKAKKLGNNELETEFQAEMSRLNGIAEVLSSFVPKDPVQVAPIDLNDLIRQQIHHQKPEAEQLGVTIESHLESNECLSQINAENLGFVLHEVIKNALEASSSGQIISISAHRGGSKCRVAVRDHGAGIMREDTDHIFKPFYTTKPDSHGLSLAVSKKMMMEMGGNIHAVLGRGTGAEFLISVPVASQ